MYYHVALLSPNLQKDSKSLVIFAARLPLNGVYESLEKIPSYVFSDGEDSTSRDDRPKMKEDFTSEPLANVHLSRQRHHPFGILYG
jgi:hypothetical protein